MAKESMGNDQQSEKTRNLNDNLSGNLDALVSPRASLSLIEPPSLTLDLILRDSQLVKENCRKKGFEIDIDEIRTLEIQRRQLIVKSDEIRQQLNQLSQKWRETDKDKREEVKTLRADLSCDLERLEQLTKLVRDKFSQIPNFASPEVPIGPEAANRVLRHEGQPRIFEFEPRDHLSILAKLDLVDFERGSKLAGRGFYFLKGDLYLLRQALSWIFMDRLRQQGFIPCSTPVLASDSTLFATGYLPWAEKDNFRLKDGLALIGTSEQALIGQHADEIMDAAILPRLYVADTQCFRTEAGASGVDTKGLIRVHQFGKVEQIVICHPGESKKWQELALENEEWLLKELKIPYRVVLIATEDMGAPGYLKYDLEAWVPTQLRYREMTSNTNFRDFQSRRLNLRCKDQKSKEKFFPHTISATGFPDRLLVAIVENYQRADGRIDVPEILRPWLKKEVI